MVGGWVYGLSRGAEGACGSMREAMELKDMDGMWTHMGRDGGCGLVRVECVYLSVRDFFAREYRGTLCLNTNEMIRLLCESKSQI